MWWRVLQFDLLWQSETRCRPKQLKNSCLVWLFSYTDASFHILDHHLKSAYQYKMHNICEVSLEWSLGHLLDFIIGFILTGCSILHWVLYPLYLFQPLTFKFLEQIVSQLSKYPIGRTMSPCYISGHSFYHYRDKKRSIIVLIVFDQILWSLK